MSIGKTAKRDRQVTVSFKSMRRVVIGLVGVFAVALVVLTVFKQDQLEQLEGFLAGATESPDWSIYQLSTERLRLELALRDASDTGTEAALEAAALRYEIFASRMELLKDTHFLTDLSTLPEYREASERIEAFLQKYDPIMMKGLERPKIPEIIGDLKLLWAPIQALVLAEIRARNEMQTVSRERITRIETSANAILAIVISLILGFAIYALNVLARARRSEEALEESEHRLADFAEVASDWYWQTDIDNRFTFVSERAQAHGVKPQSRIGTNAIDIMRSLPENQALVGQHLETLAARKPFRDLRFGVKDEDGVHYVSISGKPLFAPDGTYLGYRGCAKDISQEIATEQELREALRNAETANAAKSTFLANMSHELRTPLNAIIGFSEMLQIFAGDRLEPNQVSYLHDIHTSGRHLLDLINTILEISKMEAGKVDLDLELVAAGEIVAECVRMLTPKAQDGGVRVLVTGLKSLPPVRGDRTRLRQVVLNLLSNAIKYTPEGGQVQISGELDERRFLVLHIADEGIGMRPSDIEIAFKPFERITSSYTTNREGVGLGLPIAKNLIELHGGSLVIESQLGRGTTVTIRLPAEITTSPQGHRLHRLAYAKESIAYRGVNENMPVRKG